MLRLLFSLFLALRLARSLALSVSLYICWHPSSSLFRSFPSLFIRCCLYSFLSLFLLSLFIRRCLYSFLSLVFLSLSRSLILIVSTCIRFCRSSAPFSLALFISVYICFCPSSFTFLSLSCSTRFSLCPFLSLRCSILYISPSLFVSVVHSQPNVSGQLLFRTSSSSILTRC